MTRQALETNSTASLLLGPTAVHSLPRVSEHLGGKGKDFNSRVLYRRNKTGKYKYAAQSALKSGCDALTSISGV